VAERDFSSGLNSTLRAINTQEMLDTRQQAEFFVTLGQYDSAIEMLQAHIADAQDLNPLIYLDLLNIYHTLSRKEAFDQCRDEFQAIFTGRVPEYADFQRRGEALDAFPELCDHLVKLWPSREALDFIASCLVRHPDSAARMEFDLEAFKELLMLHGVAGRLVHALGGEAVGLGARKPAEVHSGEFQTGPLPLDISAPVSTTPPLDIDVGLDIPLDAAPVNLIDFDVSGLQAGPKK
jgi:tetratricopeptide (TPR) repeat protein